MDDKRSAVDPALSPLGGVSNNASNTTLNITRVMTTPLYALDNSKEPK